MIELELRPGATVVFTTRGEERSLTDERNRRALAQRLGVKLAYGRQVHGSRVAVVDDRWDAGGEADGRATTLREVAPMVLTADCLPVALAGEGGVAMLHAGWRGLAAGVLEEGVRALRELGVRGELQAVIGPGAGACCYEVGEEVHAAFGSRGRTLDLKGIARARLERAGVREVADVGMCTICNPELFFSYRREGKAAGRQAGIAWLS